MQRRGIFNKCTEIKDSLYVLLSLNEANGLEL